VDIGTQWDNPVPKWPETQIQETLSFRKDDIEFEPTEEEVQLTEFYIKEVLKHLLYIYTHIITNLENKIEYILFISHRRLTKKTWISCLPIFGHGLWRKLTPSTPQTQGNFTLVYVLL